MADWEHAGPPLASELPWEVADAEAPRSPTLTEISAPASRSSSAGTKTTISVTLNTSASQRARDDVSADGFEDLSDHPLARTLDHQCGELHQLREAVSKLTSVASQEQLLLQRVVADEIRKQRQQLLSVFVLLVVLLLFAVAGALALACSVYNWGAMPRVYNSLGIASREDIEALLPREEMNARTLHELSQQLDELTPKVEAFSEAFRNQEDGAPLAEYLGGSSHLRGRGSGADREGGPVRISASTEDHDFET